MSARDIDIGFVGGSYKGRSIAVDGQECINFFPEIVDNPIGNSKTKIALYPTPGLTLITNLIDTSANFTFTDGTYTWPSDVAFIRLTLTFTDTSTDAVSWAWTVYGSSDSWATSTLVTTSTDQNPVMVLSTYDEFVVELVINGGTSTKTSDHFTAGE